MITIARKIPMATIAKSTAALKPMYFTTLEKVLEVGLSVDVSILNTIATPAIQKKKPVFYTLFFENGFQ